MWIISNIQTCKNSSSITQKELFLLLSNYFTRHITSRRQYTELILNLFRQLKNHLLVSAKIQKYRWISSFFINKTKNLDWMVWSQEIKNLKMISILSRKELNMQKHRVIQYIRLEDSRLIHKGKKRFKRKRVLSW